MPRACSSPAPSRAVVNSRSAPRSARDADGSCGRRSSKICCSDCSAASLASRSRRVMHRALPALLPSDFPRIADVAFDLRIQAFAIAVSIARRTRLRASSCVARRSRRRRPRAGRGLAGARRWRPSLADGTRARRDHGGTDGDCRRPARRIAAPLPQFSTACCGRTSATTRRTSSRQP